MSRPFVVAIDPATSTGLCAGEVGGTPDLMTRGLRSAASDTEEDVFAAAILFFADYLKDRTPDLIAVEAPVTDLRGRTSAQTIAITRGLYAIYAGIAVAKGIPLIRAPIATWRKYFLGRGNLPGREAKAQCLALCRQLGWAATSHDAAEAAGIWCWACSTVAPDRAQRTEPLFARA